MRLNNSIKLFVTVSVLITFIATAFLFQKYATEIISLVNHLGWLAPVLFLIIYCLSCILFLPTMVITFAGGAIFGPFWGTILNLFGATAGAACSFLITRYLISDWLSYKKGAKLTKLIHEVDQKGWGLVALLRLFPILPFNLVNYGLGVTGIKFRTYFLTTLFFLIPPEIIYTYLGYAGMDVLLNQESIYGSSGIIISGIVILLLCILKSGLVKIKLPYPRSKKTLNTATMDASTQNQPHPERKSFEYPAGN
jgi:uncharacterized membrane protein YdjX (TVP38/TMEM64 family)